MSIYQRYCREILDEKGRLINFELDYPENFNFGYDVVDVIAKESPEKQALVWCNTDNAERIFSFEELRTLSNKAANVFKKAGIKRGDRVMLILKRHYEYWITVIALAQAWCYRDSRYAYAYRKRYCVPPESLRHSSCDMYTAKRGS